MAIPPSLMAQLKDKIENSLNECRILLLGGQVLIGFFFRGFFEPTFAKLPMAVQYTEVAMLAIMLLSLGLLIWPAAYHRIVLRGEVSTSLHRFATAVIAVALFPFAVSVGGFAYFPIERVAGPPWSLVAGVGTAVAALGAWYGLELYIRWRRHGRFRPSAVLRPVEHTMEDSAETIDLTEKIKQVLIETRMVLPGAQALLGFQFITVF